MTDRLSQARDTGIEARGVLLGERINVRGLAPANVVHTAPLAFRTADGGLVVVYRFGAVVFVGVDERVQDETIEAMRAHIIEPADQREAETVALVTGGGEDALVAPGKINLVDFAEARVLAVADVLAKSVALADDERFVSKVFELIEPFAANLAATGGVAIPTKNLLKLLGEALVAQARMVGRVEVQERPDLLWERPDLHRLHAKLAEEYELDDRARALARKLKVIEESASTLANLNDSRRALRLEVAIVALIAFEIMLSLIDRSRWFG